MANIADIRTDYTKMTLLEDNVKSDALEQFKVWFDDALQANIPEPNICLLATANAQGVPSSRIILLKGVDEQGLQFFTNYESHKAQDLKQNPRASLVFFWRELQRQVRLDGRVEKLSREESEAYFHSRPRESQLGAWASQQSSKIANREYLEQRFQELQEQYRPEDTIPLPPFWGGYRLLPHYVEFWQGRANRLHDRLAYSLSDSQWQIERLAP